MLRRGVIITPPPGARSGGPRARPTNPETLASLSDDTFFTSCSGEPSTSYTVSSSSSDTILRARGIETGSAVLTEETSDSGIVVPQRYRGEHTSYLGSLSDPRHSIFKGNMTKRGGLLERAYRVPIDWLEEITIRESPRSWSVCNRTEGI